ncbi:MAG: hypothetical protein ABIH59_02725 [archaeon]
MNFQFYVEKLFANEHFQKFKEENKTAYPCSAFFIVDLEGKDNQQHFDYWIPEDKKMFSFKLESGGEKVPVEMMDENIPEEIKLNFDFEFKDIEKMIQERMDQEKITNKIQKFLFSFQKKDNKHYFVGTVFISSLSMLKVAIDIEDMKITRLEKKSFFDIMKPIKRKEED